jgi:antitoxin MazE
MSHNDMLHHGVSVVKRNDKNQLCYYIESVRVKLRPIGDSHGIVIPKSILSQLDLTGAAEAEVTVDRNTLVVRRIAAARRSGWAQAAKQIAAADSDLPALGDFANDADEQIIW